MAIYMSYIPFCRKFYAEFKHDISLANCNFMMVGQGPLVKVTDSYLVLQHSVKPTFLENCVTISEAIPVPTNYTFKPLLCH